MSKSCGRGRARGKTSRAPSTGRRGSTGLPWASVCFYARCKFSLRKNPRWWMLQACLDLLSDHDDVRTRQCSREPHSWDFGVQRTWSQKKGVQFSGKREGSWVQGLHFTLPCGFVSPASFSWASGPSFQRLSQDVPRVPLG